MKISSSLLLAVLLGIITYSCTQNNIQTSKQGYNAAIQPLIDNSDLAPQNFKIDNTKDTVLIGTKGTIIRLEANTFKSGSSNLDIELIEAPEVSDMVLLNTQTVSNDKLLKTAGVIYLQASDENGIVEIVEGKNVEIKIQAKEINQNMTAFVGNFDENGIMNWEVKNKLTFDTSVVEFNELISKGMFEIPFDLFPYRQEYYRMDSLSKKYPSKNGIVKAPLKGYLVSPERSKFYKKLINIIESDVYESTHLATREFAERLYRLQYIDHTYSSSEPESDGLFELSSDRYAYYQNEALKIYESNLTKPLWYSDSLVYELIKKYTPKPFAASHWQSYKSNCQEQKNYFLEYYQDRMTALIEIENLGIDLNDKNAFNELVTEGMSPEKANNTIRLHRNQQLIIESLIEDDKAFIKSLDDKEEFLKKERARNQIKYYVISANELGWINVDMFYNNPSAQDVDLLVEVKDLVDADFTTVNLILPDQDSYVSGWLDKENTYRFTRDKDFYTKLPIGEKAFIVVISYKQDKPYLAIKEFIIRGDKKFSLTLSSCTISEFKSRLGRLDNTKELSEVV